MNLPRIIKDYKIYLKEEDILNRIQDRIRWPKEYPWGQPSIEAVKKDGLKHQNFFNEDGYVNSNECIKHYESGQTLVISDIGYINTNTSFIQKLLNETYNKKINCNFYFGKGNKKVSFKKHSHPYAVIIKNIYGDSTWIINKKKYKLNNQNVFVIDKNIDHEVVSIETPKLSMTINLE